MKTCVCWAVNGGDGWKVSKEAKVVESLFFFWSIGLVYTMDLCQTLKYPYSGITIKVMTLGDVMGRIITSETSPEKQYWLPVV